MLLLEDVKTDPKIYISLVISLLGIAVSWGMMTQQIQADTGRIDTIEDKQDKMVEDISTIRVDVGQIKTSVGFISDQFK